MYMDNITTRTRYLMQNTTNNINEYDLGSFDPKDYDFGDVKYYMVTKYEECRPDIISMKIYGTENYWWFLMWYNGISDVWNDLVQNMVIKAPDLSKVREFLRNKNNNG